MVGLFPYPLAEPPVPGFWRCRGWRGKNGTESIRPPGASDPRGEAVDVPGDLDRLEGTLRLPVPDPDADDAREAQRREDEQQGERQVGAQPEVPDEQAGVLPPTMLMSWKEATLGRSSEENFSRMSRLAAFEPGRDESDQGVDREQRPDRVGLGKGDVEHAEPRVVQQEQASVGRVAVGYRAPEDRCEDDGDVDEGRRERDLGPGRPEGHEDQEGERHPEAEVAALIGMNTASHGRARIALRRLGFGRSIRGLTAADVGGVA